MVQVGRPCIKGVGASRTAPPAGSPVVADHVAGSRRVVGPRPRPAAAEPDAEYPRAVPRVLAHRGDTAGAPENTLAAFHAAVASGADGVELDVRRTADGALVVHHDAAVAGLGPLSSLRVRELPEAIPLLDAAMEVLEPILVNVEVKNDPDEPGHDPTGSLSHDVVALLEERGDLDRVVLSSFDLPTLDAARQASATVATGWLLGMAADPAGAIETAVARGHSALHPFVLTVDAAVVDEAHDAGLEVATWTVNARHDLERMAALGVDTVITDDVALALDVARSAARNGVPGPASA
jgi:glycerophosphoryl diester phosphodiesterase